MKFFRRHWLLVFPVLIAALLVSCQTTIERPPPSQPPVEVPPIQTPVVETPPNQPHVFKPPLAQAPDEELPPDDSYKDLSDLRYSNPADIDNSNLPITPTDKLGVTGWAPEEVDISEYRLTVEGLVETPLSLTYNDILAYPAVTEVVLLICPDAFVDNAEWTGVPVTTILTEARIKPEASQITFYAMDRYRVVKSVEEVQKEGVFLAHTVNGQILPIKHGYPVR